MQAYIATERFDIHDFNVEPIYKGNIYLPSIELMIENIPGINDLPSRQELSHFHSYKFERLQHSIHYDKLKKIELNDKEIQKILNIQQQQKRLEEDLASAVKDLHSNAIS